MTGLKKSYSRSILRLLEIPHGIIIIIKLLLLLQLLPYATAQTGTALPPPSPYPFNPKFSPSMAIILVVLVSAFFFMGFFSVYIRQCAERRLVRSFREEFVGGGGGRRSRRAAARGLDPAVIETFPTFVYSEVKGLKIGKGSLECAVCLNEFEDDETLRLLPKCNHVFHPGCIDAWLGSHTTCPVCRAHLVPKPGDVVYATTLVQDSEGESGHRPDTDDAQNQVMIRVADDGLIEPTDVIDPNEVTNQNRPPRIRSTRGRITGKFPRSHSTGHSLIQPGENCERFTLRLPEEVRNQIVNTSLNRTKSCVAFPRVRSSRTGYRSSSGGGKNYMSYERFDRDTRWGFSMTPPFFSRTGSARSPKLAAGDAATSTSTPFNLFKSVKSPFDRLFLPVDNVGERSSDRLRSDSQL